MWNFFKSVFTGQDHIEEGKPCQDYAEYTITENGIYVAALADGASGAYFSDIAASCNVNSVLNLFHKLDFNSLFTRDEKLLKQSIINACLSAIFDNVKRISSSSPADFAATLLFLVSDGERALIGHLGDGVICAINNDQNVEIISYPSNINNECNRTIFTVSNKSEDYLNLYHIENINNYLAFLMMSDGPETSFYDYTLKQMRKRNLLTIVTDIGKERARELELTYFLKSNFWKFGITGDDCSMVVFARELD